MKERITKSTLLKKMKTNEKITALTAYDFPFARVLDEAGIDIILVGDSLGMTVQGLENTLPVTLDEIIYHTKMVVRARKKAMVIADMPFMSFQVSTEETLINAGHLIKESGADGVKLEDCGNIVDKIKSLTSQGIAVMGHLGFTPQSIHQIGGYRVKGKNVKEAQSLIKKAKLLEKAGCFSIVLEMIPQNIAKIITQSIKIPTIGIGAGIHCDGQILVLHDVLGLYMNGSPKFSKRYADLQSTSSHAVKQYIKETKRGKFPDKEHSF